MRKILFILFAISLISLDLKSQDLIKQKCYKKIKGECIPKLEIYKKSDGTYLIKEFNRDGTFKMIANSTSSNPYKLNGYVKFYTDKGVLQSEGTYKHNYICCDWKIYNANGELERNISYEFSEQALDTSTIFPEKEYVDSTFEEMPKYNNGRIEEFRDYVVKQLFYPPLAAKNGIQGKVFVQFSIDKYGNLVDSKVVRGIDKDLDNEALRVVRNSPKWTPGYQKGKPVKVQFTMPIVFILN